MSTRKSYVCVCVCLCTWTCTILSLRPWQWWHVRSVSARWVLKFRQNVKCLSASHWKFKQHCMYILYMYVLTKGEPKCSHRNYSAERLLKPKQDIVMAQSKTGATSHLPGSVTSLASLSLCLAGIQAPFDSGMKEKLFKCFAFLSPLILQQH